MEKGILRHRDRVARRAPGGYAALERLCFRETLRLILGRLTGSRAFVRSAAVEDDLLALWQGRGPGFEAGQGDRPVEPRGVELGLIRIRADEERLFPLHLAPCVGNTDTLDFRHGSLLSELPLPDAPDSLTSGPRFPVLGFANPANPRRREPNRQSLSGRAPGFPSCVRRPLLVGSTVRAT